MKIIVLLGLCLALILTTSKHASAKALVTLEEPLEANVPSLYENDGQKDSELGRENLDIITNQKLNDQLDQGKNSC